MCDANTYATGVLMTQISAGLLASVLINAASTALSTRMPVAKAVPVENAAPSDLAPSTPSQDETEKGTAATRLERVGQTLRRRAVDVHRVARRKESVTISIQPEQAKQMRFDF